MIIEDSLEEIFKPQLQKNLQFELNNKVYKRGKLSLYKLETYSNNYEITLMLEKNGPNSVECFKIPYPFKYEVYGDGEGNSQTTIFFDYRLYTLSNNDPKIEKKLLELSKNYKKSKYFNGILKIECNIKL